MDKIIADKQASEIITGLTIEQLHKYFTDPTYLRDCLYDQYINGFITLAELEQLQQ